jgi:hypothetical protein
MSAASTGGWVTLVDPNRLAASRGIASPGPEPRQLRDYWSALPWRFPTVAYATPKPTINT